MTSRQSTRTADAAGDQVTPEDHVILMDDDGTPRGLAPRATVHTTDTPLHLAFSCYVVDSDGQVLLTRRALTKRTWPGVWTNSFCGHPRQGESFSDAITRHAEHELGMEVNDPEEALPGFRYRAVDASGVVENEICPVFVAVAASEPVPHHEEVMDLRWVSPAELAALVELAPWTLSPWTTSQVPQLREVLERIPASTS
ncbi:isopentenyl-diphosphate Delta-isomerase [Brachybacterium paraconglomeratum]|uniref:isopentenyl-diphosphate Delta-isomerase n=1 Tax=Brachybacterium paraconglomeratum TaxID=173362 RepID=UPI0031F08BEC